MHPQPFRDDCFWEAESDWFLHLPSTLARVRPELSGAAPITLEEIWHIAITEMGYSHHHTAFEADEVARPLSLIATVWAYKALCLPAAKARSFGFFIGTWAGGDAFFGGSLDQTEKQATEILHGWPTETNAPADTHKVIEAVLAVYRQ